MRSTLRTATALVLLLSATLASAAQASAGVRADTSGLRHHLVLASPSVVAGQVEHTAEVVRNDHPFPVDAWGSWVLTSPCGGSLVGDPVSRTIAANGGTATWRFDAPTSTDCTGTYTLTATVTDRHGSGQDTRTFEATPP